jgi:hypothetical protein
MASEDTDMVTGPSGEGSSAGGSSSAASKRPKRFEIKKWNAVALWAWGMYLLFFFPPCLIPWECGRRVSGFVRLRILIVFFSLGFQPEA